MRCMRIDDVTCHCLQFGRARFHPSARWMVVSFPTLAGAIALMRCRRGICADGAHKPTDCQTGTQRTTNVPLSNRRRRLRLHPSAVDAHKRQTLAHGWLPPASYCGVRAVFSSSAVHVCLF